MWSLLRNRQINGAKFRRQQPLGIYFLDFVCFEKKLVVEIDGGQHSDPPIIEKDRERTGWLESQGFRVLRFWNNDVQNNPDGVISKINEALNNGEPSTQPSPIKGEGASRDC
jgi:very-short-patch-repair endonuclease